MANLYQNDLIRLIRGIISTGLTTRGFGSIPVLQAYQPTQQGTSTNATVYYNIIYNYQYGYLGADTNPIDSDPGKTNLEETQYYETKIQIDGLVISSPANTAAFTALDLITAVASILQSEQAVTLLQAVGVGVLRITSINSPNFQDDRDQFEQSPNFDFVLTYKNVNISAIPILQSVELGIFPV